MDIIFIGQFVSFDEALTNKNYSQASNLFQNKVLRFTNPTLAISIIPIFIFEEKEFSYPDSPTKFIYNRASNHPKFIRNISRLIKDTNEAVKLVLPSKSNDVWFYNLNKSTFLIALFIKLFSRKRLFIIIADYEYETNNIVKIFINKLIQNFNGSIVLNSNIKHKNRIVLPGILDSNSIQFKNNGVLNNNFILSGSLGKTTGFEMALEYFSKNPKFNLYITGKPFGYKEKEFNDLLKKYVVPNKNIKYFGLLSYDNYYKVLDSVDIALSLRDPYDVQHDYNFPSKILEYLSFSKIVISTKKYADIDSNLYFYTENSELAMDRLLNTIYELSEKEVIEKRNYIYNNLITKFTKDALENAIQSVSK